jgi:hypothetical protein
MPGVYARFSVGRSGGSAANMHYITRPSATGRDEDALLIRNYPEYAREGEDYGELRENLEAYARQQEDEELERPRRGGGEPRTYYRMILSFEQKVPTDQARDMTDEYLDREFPDARSVAAVHQDTDKTHVHVHMEARDVDGHKLHFDRGEYEHLSDEWAEIYGRELGHDRADEYFEKKEETREWKAEYAHALSEGREPPEPPERADRPDTSREIDDREVSSHSYDEARAGGPERDAADATPGGDDRQGPAGALADERDRAVQAADRTDSEARATVHAAEELVDRELERERDRDDDRGR